MHMHTHNLARSAPVIIRGPEQRRHAGIVNVVDHVVLNLQIQSTDSANGRASVRTHVHTHVHACTCMHTDTRMHAHAHTCTDSAHAVYSRTFLMRALRHLAVRLWVAQWMGSRPSVSAILWSAPRSSSSTTIARAPPYAARCSAVAPSGMLGQ